MSAQPRRITLGLALALAASPLLPACAMLTPTRLPLRGPAVALAGTLWQDLADTASGVIWRVSIQQPLTPPPPGGHPLLLVLDGQRSFALAAQLARITLDRPADVRGDIPVIVGLDIPGDAPAERQRRYADGAGADALLRFLARQLLPALSAQWPLDPARRTLFGHSITGLFTVHTLLTQGDLFSGYAAASPSLWLLPDPIPLPRQPLRARVQISAGALEDPAHAPTPERAARLIQRQPIARARALADQLHARFTLYPQADHGATLAPALMDAFALARLPAP